jgi:hypothetical protein
MNTILYPMGGGGHWLSYVLWMLAQDRMDFDKPAVNFHQQPEYKKILITHMLEKKHIQSNQYYRFSSAYSFNSYINFYVKKRIADNFQNFNQLNFLEQLRTLSNDARWRMGDEFLKEYTDNLDLDYKNIFLNPVEFKDQLNIILSNTNLEKLVNQEFINCAIDIFVPTVINPADHVGNYQSLAWLAWGHSICLTCDVDTNGVDFGSINNTKSFLQQHHDLLIKQSLPFILYH